MENAQMLEQELRLKGYSSNTIKPYLFHSERFMIEFIWKSARGRVSQVFAKSEWAFKETIRTTFHRLAKKETFAVGWMENFGLFSNLLCP